MIKISIVFLCILYSVFSFAQDDLKYSKFKFTPIFSIKTNISIPSELSIAYSEYFNEPLDFANKSIIHYLKLDSNRYFIHAIRPTKVSDKTKKMFSNNNFSTAETKGKHFRLIGVVDVENKTIHRVLNDSVADMSWKSALGKGLSYNGREGNLAYGCQVDQPFRFQDLNLDGVPELIFLGGTGEFYRDPNGDGVDIGIQTTIRIFDLSGNKPQQIFYDKLSTENYGGEYFAEENGVANPGYQSFSTHRFLKDGERVDSNVGRQAERSYSKLYFVDLDMDGKLNIIIFNKKYLSNSIKNTKKGFRLAKSEYIVYELESDKFLHEKIKSDFIIKYLSENNLSWGNGWPNKNICKVYGYVDGQFKKYTEDDAVILNLTNSPHHSLE